MGHRYYKATTYNYLFLLNIMWWRRRESNPRPKIIRTGVYILIPNFGFRPSGPLRTGSLKAYPDEGFAGAASGNPRQLSR